MRVLRSRDRVWRVEVRAGACTVFRDGFKVLERADLDRVVVYLIRQGVAPDRDLVED
jgi:hypothetical protein